jgi:probable phosphomutase (TIGR03848 family)
MGLLLLLIRHATNDWVGDRLAGWTPGVHLNDAGRGEAAVLAARLATYPLDAVYASPLERAQETGGFVAAPHGLPVRTLDGLGEVRCGAWTGRTLTELQTDPLWPAILHQPSHTRIPGGETLAEVQARAVAAIEAIRAAHPRGVVAAVSHGDVVKAVVAHYVGMHLDLFQRLVVDTCALSAVRFTRHGPRLVLFNDTGSLPPPPHPHASDAEPPVEGVTSAPEPDLAPGSR